MANDPLPGRTRARLAAFALIALATLTGCASQSGPTAAPAPAAPEAQPMIDCGEVDTGLDATIPNEIYECLGSGQGAGARATLTFNTTEGDPIVNHYRVRSTGVEVFVDSTADRFKGQSWAVIRCPELSNLRQVEEYGRCTTEELDEAPAL